MYFTNFPIPSTYSSALKLMDKDVFSSVFQINMDLVIDLVNVMGPHRAS